MKAEGGIIVTQGCSMFSDSQASPPGSSCDISSPMNAYSPYSGGTTQSRIYPDPATNYTTLLHNTSFPSPQAVFCGAHQFTVETYFTSLNSIFQDYMVMWTFHSVSTGQQIANVRLDSFSGSGNYFQPSTSYTVVYNNGLVSWPNAPSPTVTETSTASEFYVTVSVLSQYSNALGAKSLTVRGYFH